MSNLRVMDKAGIVVSSWKRGDVFTLPAGSDIKVSNFGQWICNGKILAIGPEVKVRLLAGKRVV